MTYIEPTLLLECAECGHRPPPDSVQEALLLHFQVEHDTDKIHMNLSAVCTCGKTMTFVETKPTGGGVRDWFRCDADGNEGFVFRDPTKGQP